MPKIRLKTLLIAGALAVIALLAAAFISAKRDQAEYEGAQRAKHAPHDCNVYAYGPDSRLDELHADGTKTPKTPTSADRRAVSTCA